MKTLSIESTGENLELIREEMRINDLTLNDVWNELNALTDIQCFSVIEDYERICKMNMLFPRLIILYEFKNDNLKYNIHLLNSTFNDLRSIYMCFFVLEMTDITKDIRTILRNKMKEFGDVKAENEALTNEVLRLRRELDDVYKILESDWAKSDSIQVNGDCPELNNVGNTTQTINNNVITNIIPGRPQLKIPTNSVLLK